MHSLREAIAAAKKELIIQVADTPELRRESFQLRHQVYCVEHHYEDGAAGIESDEFDARSRHVVVRDRAGRHVLGTARLILPRPGAIENSFPFQRVCDRRLLRRIPLHSAGEVSRFAISKQRRAASGAANPGLRLALIKGVIRMSTEAGHTHLLAIMEPTLLRLLRASGLHFAPLGPAIEYHGIRQPAFTSLENLLRRVASECHEVWEFITEGGRWHAPESELLAA